MREILQFIRHSIVALALISVASLCFIKSSFGQTNPTSFDLSTGSWALSGWSSSVSAGSYPLNGNTGTQTSGSTIATSAATANMVFWTYSGDQTLTANASGTYNSTYSPGSGKIVGNGTSGFYFDNTGGVGIGSAVLVLNTTNRKNIQVSWVGRTITVGARQYQIRLQYRIGTSGNFSDASANTSDILYTGAAAGSSQAMTTITLPAAAENQSVVQLLWRFYYSGTTTGTRPQFGVDDIIVSSSASATLPEPTNQPTLFGKGTVTTTAIPLTWTAAATGSQAPDGYLVKLNTGAVVDPADGTDLADVTAVTSGAANKKVTPGTASGTTSFTGMTAGTMYNYKIYSYTNSSTLIDFKLTSAPSLSVATLPNAVAGLAFTATGTTTANISWTAASGYNASNHSTLVFVKSGSTAIATGTPTNAPTSYSNVSTNFAAPGAAYQLDASAFCVYNGDGTSVSLTGLTAGTTYQVLVLTVVDASNSDATNSYSAYNTASGNSLIVNDDCSGAIGITLGAAAISGDVTGATQSLVATCVGTANDDVWYSFTTSSAGTYTITVVGSASFDAVVDLRSGGCNGTNIFCSDATNSGEKETIVATGLTANTTYLIRVYDYSSGVATTRTFTISVSAPPPVAIAATNLSSAQFDANWNTVPNATDYLLDVSTAPVFLTPGPILTEGFEDATFPPAGWTSTGWTRSTSAGDVNSGSGAAIVGTNTGSLTTPAIANPSSMTFYLGRTSNTAAKTLTVGVSTTSQSTGFTTVMTYDNNNVPSGSYNQYTVDLTAYSSSPIVYIRFTKSSSTTSPWRLDDVVINTTGNTLLANYNPKSIAGQATTSTSVTGLSAATTYYYRVRAVTALDATANSNVISAATYANSITNADFRTKATGNFSSTSLWEYNTGNAGYVNANQVPASTNNITVQSAHILTLDANHSVGTNKTLTIATGGGLIISETSNLDMLDNTGTINFNNQPVTVKSSLLGTGSIGKMLGAVTGATNVTVERYIPQNLYKAWRLLSVNTSGQTINQAWQEGQTGYASNTNPGYGTMIAGKYTTLTQAQDNGFDTLSKGYSLYKYDATTDNLIGILNTNNTQLSSERGYFIFIRGDRSSNQFGGPANSPASTSTTLRSKGTIFTGTQPSLTVPTGQYALLGNPYASAIDMRAVMATRATSSLSNSFEVWDPKLNGGLGGYQNFVFDAVENSYEATVSGGSYPQYYNNIESGSAVFLQNFGQSQDAVTISENVKVSGSRIVNRPPAALSIDGKLRANLILSDGSSTIVDGNMVRFNEIFSDTLDGYDVRKSLNFAENFGITREGILLSLERRTLPAADDTVYYQLSNLKKINYKLEFIGQNIIVPSGLSVFLYDKYTGAETPINWIDTTQYDFVVNNDAGSAAADRFKLIFKGLQVLPVNFTKIAASPHNKDILVEWNVSNQQDVTKYQIERSTDGRIFDVVGSVLPVSDNEGFSYSWLDKNFKEKKNFYRVKAVYLNGESKYTDVASVFIRISPEIIVVTNLIKNGSLIYLDFRDQEAGKYNIKVLNSLGQIMYKNIITYLGGSGYQSFTISSQLADGVYQIEIQTPNNNRQIQKLVVSSGN